MQRASRHYIAGQLPTVATKKSFFKTLCGHNEILKTKKRYALIDYEGLMEKNFFKNRCNPAEFQSATSARPWLYTALD